MWRAASNKPFLNLGIYALSHEILYRNGWSKRFSFCVEAKRVKNRSKVTRSEFLISCQFKIRTRLDIHRHGGIQTHTDKIWRGILNYERTLCIFRSPVNESCMCACIYVCQSIINNFPESITVINIRYTHTNIDQVSWDLVQSLQVYQCNTTFNNINMAAGRRCKHSVKRSTFMRV